MATSWKCSECGEEFDASEHRAVIICFEGNFIGSCTHHPELLDNATVILGGRSCSVTFAAKKLMAGDRGAAADVMAIAALYGARMIRRRIQSARNN